MKYISELSIQSRPWLLLALTALGFELVALFFQHAMALEPCIMCVYQRAAIAAIFIAGVIGTFAHHIALGRLIAYGLWATGAIWGLLLAIEHVDMQSSSSLFFSCEFIPNFPTWAPLHEWLPWLFAVTGDCGDIDWLFLDYSMPQWMIAIYSLYSGAFILVILARLLASRKI